MKFSFLINVKCGWGMKGTDGEGSMRRREKRHYNSSLGRKISISIIIGEVDVFPLQSLLAFKLFNQES